MEGISIPCIWSSYTANGRNTDHNYIIHRRRKLTCSVGAEGWG